MAVLGAAAFWDSSSEEAAAAFEAALSAGVNHVDVAPSYGAAERLLGPLLPPTGVFVACKTLRKNPDGVRAQLEASLSILGRERFDLYQAHAVTSVAELDERAAALDALLRARDEGLVRFVGITGHDVGTAAAQAEALRRYDLDTVMFPVSPRMWADAAYRRDAEALLALAASRDVGVMAIKAVAARPRAADSTATTWYEPYWSPSEVARGVRFALSVPGVHAFCTPGDVRVLPLALEAAASFEAMPVDEQAEAVAAVAAEPSIFPMPVMGA